MPIGLAIFLWVIGILILYIVIETAVRRGIDSSKLNERIEAIQRDINKNNSSK